MKKLNFITVAVLTVSLAFFSFVQVDEFVECKNELKSYVTELSKIGTPGEKKTYFMSMTVVTDMNVKSKVPDSQVNVDVFMSANQLHYVSDVMNTYQDERDAFAIVSKKKIIIWSRGGKIEAAAKRNDLAIQMQDSLINLSSVVSCKTVEENGTVMKIVTMVPYKKVKEVFNVLKLEYTIDLNKKRLTKSTTYYLPTANIVSQSITYKELDLNYTKVQLTKPVYQLILTDDGELRSKYKGYQLIDNRN